MHHAYVCERVGSREREGDNVAGPGFAETREELERRVRGRQGPPQLEVCCQKILT